MSVGSIQALLDLRAAASSAPAEVEAALAAVRTLNRPDVWSGLGPARSRRELEDLDRRIRAWAEEMAGLVRQLDRRIDAAGCELLGVLPLTGCGAPPRSLFPPWGVHGVDHARALELWMSGAEGAGD